MNKQSVDHFLNRCLRAKLGRFKMRTQILIINGTILTLLIPSILIAYAINIFFTIPQREILFWTCQNILKLLQLC
ncbi:unnamed protein product [Paramecium octaurelia]|uniref:Uncharacterized protein n=1 Tax=Paramecium octaurelia TaxID=43137 RepID=A0A8S1XTP1_PAROT|nr:unnamed protein product [Paramecium octaurelia]